MVWPTSQILMEVVRWKFGTMCFCGSVKSDVGPGRFNLGPPNAPGGSCQSLRSRFETEVSAGGLSLLMSSVCWWAQFVEVNWEQMTSGGTWEAHMSWCSGGLCPCSCWRDVYCRVVPSASSSSHRHLLLQLPAPPAAVSRPQRLSALTRGGRDLKWKHFGVGLISVSPWCEEASSAWSTR